MLDKLRIISKGIRLFACVSLTDSSLCIPVEIRAAIFDAW